MILILSMAMGADYSFEHISIETYAPQYIWHNKFFLGSVFWNEYISIMIYHNYPIQISLFSKKKEQTKVSTTKTSADVWCLVIGLSDGKGIQNYLTWVNILYQKIHDNQSFQFGLVEEIKQRILNSFHKNSSNQGID